MNTLIELHDKAVADAVAAAIANKGDRDLPSRAALVQGIEELQRENEALRSLLDEVSANCTRDDDLPDGLLGRIDAAIGEEA